MPLERGTDRETISRNIREMMHRGYPQKQAVAASLRTSRLPRREKASHTSHMARKKKHPRSHARRSTAIVVRPVMSHPRPSRAVVVRTVRAPVKHHRSARRGTGKGFTEKHRMGAILGGAVLGLLDKSAVSIPTLPFLGKAGTAGLVAWGVGKYMHNAWAEDLATGMLAIAAYELAKEGKIEGDYASDASYVAGL